MRISAPALLGLCALALTTPAAAETTPLSPLYACQAITDAAARLACFDQTAATIKTQEDSGAVVSVDKSRAERIQREAFGFNLPSLPKLGLPGSGADVEAVQATLVGLSPLGEGHYLFRLDNGQVWEQVDDRLERPRALPTPITIKKAAMGSYLLKIGTQRAVRVRRAQ